MSRFTDADLRRLRADLEALRDSLEQSLRETRDNVAPVSLDEPIGRLSRMDALQQQSMASAQRDRVRGRLQRVVAALSRMDEGSYGECLRCGEEIGVGRLQIQPEATLCRACQGERDEA